MSASKSSSDSGSTSGGVIPPTKWQRHQVGAHFPDPSLESIPIHNVGTLSPRGFSDNVDNSKNHPDRFEKAVHHGKFDFGQIRDLHAEEDLLPDINRHATLDVGRFSSFYGTEPPRLFQEPH